MKRALCIWLPHWPLQRLAVARAELSRAARCCCIGCTPRAEPAWCVIVRGCRRRRRGCGEGIGRREAPESASEEHELLRQRSSHRPKAKDGGTLRHSSGHAVGGGHGAGQLCRGGCAAPGIARSAGRSAGAGNRGRVVPAVQPQRGPGRSGRAGEFAAGHERTGPRVRQRGGAGPARGAGVRAPQAGGAGSTGRHAGSGLALAHFGDLEIAAHQEGATARRRSWLLCACH